MPAFDRILERTVEHFSAPSALPRIRFLIHYARQMEDWFKVEMMEVLRRSCDLIVEWSPEVHYEWCPKKMCDFVLQARPTEPCQLIGIEIKTGGAVKQGTRRLVQGPEETCRVEFVNEGFWPLSWMQPGVAQDARRLVRSKCFTDRICLLFAYGPLDEQFQENIAGFAHNLDALGPEGEPPFHAETIGDVAEGYGRIDLGGDEIMCILAFRIAPR